MTPFSFESSRKLSLSPKNDGFLRLKNNFTEFFGVEEGGAVSFQRSRSRPGGFGHPVNVLGACPGS